MLISARTYFRIVLSALMVPGWSWANLVIPMGSYLGEVDLSNTQYSEQVGYLSARIFTSVEASKHINGSEPRAGSVGDCWQSGHDIYIDRDIQIQCNDSVIRSPDNAALGLYTLLTPYGNYLDSCTGILQVRDSGRNYLFASCNVGEYNRLFGTLQSRGLDITDCPAGRVSNNHGSLECKDISAVRKVITGSYLESCSLTTAYYSPDNDRLKVKCNFLDKVLDNASLCVNSGGDIAYLDDELACIEPSSGRPSEIHTASQYIPPGSYPLTCNKIAFFPCMGENRQGVLSASCKKGSRYHSCDYMETRLEDTDSHCRIKELGIIRNSGGTLVCNPDESFMASDEEKEQLKERLQCPQ